jgi:uncharacterized membrane protein/glutaredoxin
MSRRRSARQRNRKLPNWPLLGVALAGMGLTGYLSLTAWFGSHALYCGQGSTCDIVQSSHWSTLLGLPIAFWGFLTYATLAQIAYRVRRAETHWAFAWIVSLSGLGVSLYLTAISIFVLEATCAYCLGSLALMATAFGVVLWQRPREPSDLRWPSWLAQTGGVTAGILVVLHLHFSGVVHPAAGPEDPYLKALAIHLTEVGAKFYGASWCPHCDEQKALFKSSAHRLPYVECSPNGRNGPLARACATLGIRNYPTWIIDGQRRIQVLRPAALARHSGFEGVPDD